MSTVRNIKPPTKDSLGPHAEGVASRGLRPPIKVRPNSNSDVAPKLEAKLDVEIPKAPALPSQRRRHRRSRQELLKSFSSPLQEASYVIQRVMKYEDAINGLVNGASDEARAIIHRYLGEKRDETVS